MAKVGIKTIGNRVEYNEGDGGNSRAEQQKSRKYRGIDAAFWNDEFDRIMVDTKQVDDLIKKEERKTKMVIKQEKKSREDLITRETPMETVTTS